MTPAQITALNSELHTDPLKIGYAAYLPGDPQHAADLINAPTQTMVQPISPSVALIWAASGPMSAIVDASNSTTNTARASALAFLKYLEGVGNLDMQNTDVSNMFNSWVPGVITQAQHDALIAKATQPASRAQVLGLPALTARDILTAW